MEPSIPLAYSLVLEPRHLIMSMLLVHGGRLERERERYQEILREIDREILREIDQERERYRER